MRRLLVFLAALGSVGLSLNAFGPRGALAQTTTAKQSTVFLCNQTREPIIAQYVLQGGKPLALSQALNAYLGTVNAPAACLAIRIPSYTGPISFTGAYGSRHFTTKVLSASYGTPIYVWYYMGKCFATTLPSKACLTLGH
jgi:hypothetical protein